MQTTKQRSFSKQELQKILFATGLNENQASIAIQRIEKRLYIPLKTINTQSKETQSKETQSKETQSKETQETIKEKENQWQKTENAHLNELKEKVINQKNGFDDNKPAIIEFHSEKNQLNQEEDYIDLQASTLMQNPEKITEE